MSQPSIKVYERSVYGRQTIYPTGAEASLLRSLTRKKTLDPIDLRNLEGLGFDIEFVPDPQTQLSKGRQLALNL